MRIWGLSERRQSPLTRVDGVLASSKKPLLPPLLVEELHQLLTDKQLSFRIEVAAVPH